MKICNASYLCALLASSLFLATSLTAQVSVNQDNSAPDPSAMLDVKSSDKGMLVPRMTTAQRTTISNPATGLLVFDTDDESFWYRDSGGWVRLISGWNLNGNAGTVDGTNFIGTTDNVALDFRVNNARGLRLEYAEGIDPDFGIINTAPNIIGGFSGNTVAAWAYGATISGGGISGNINTISAEFATIGGGLNNTADGYGAVVSGGQDNSASGGSSVGGGILNTASGGGAVVSGGLFNSATSSLSTVGGGEANMATAITATVAGGEDNIAGGISSTVPGGSLNSAGGDYSLAAGRRAKIDAAHDGAFLFSDHNNVDFNSAAADEFAVRATGGVRFVTAIDGSGNPTQTVRIDNTGTVSAAAFVGDGSGLTNLPSVADNLGNHTATQNLTLNGKWLSGDGGNEGVFVDANGNVGIGKSPPTAPLNVFRAAGEHAIVHIEAAGSTSEARLELSKLGGVASAGIGYYPGNGFLRLRTNSSNHIVFEPNGLEAMRIEDGGNVGIGTDNPDSKLDIRGDGKIMILKANTAGSSSYVEMSNAGGGLIGRIGADGTGFSGTNGLFSLGTWTNSDIGFFTNQTERMRILSSGKVTVGQGPTFGGGVLSARNDADNAPVASIWNNGYDPDNTDNPKHDGLYIKAGRDQNNSANSVFILFQRPDGTTIGGVKQINANNVSYENTSDIRLKTNIQPTRFSVADLMKIAVRDYEYKDEPGEVFTGYLAQQLYEVFPNAVTPGGRDAKTDPWMVDYSKLTPLLTKAVQDQQKTIEAQEKRISELENQLAQQSADIEAIKAALSIGLEKPVPNSNQ